MLAFSVCRIFPFTCCPSICVSRFGIEGATYSITPVSRASWASRFLFFVMTSSAKVSFLPCLLAVATENLTRAFIIFSSFMGFVPSADICTGWADPITVKGAIAAISVPIRMRVPADQAFPLSGTYPITGTLVFSIVLYDDLGFIQPSPRGIQADYESLKIFVFSFFYCIRYNII